MIGSQGDAEDVVICPGCGLRLPRLEDGVANPQVNASAECQRFCHELSLYTLAHGDAFFIHQVTVDAYAAQHAGPSSKPITVAFALIGLCLLIERGHTGKAVQRAHMRLANRSKRWPSFDAPADRGIVTVAVRAIAPFWVICDKGDVRFVADISRGLDGRIVVEDLPSCRRPAPLASRTISPT